MLSCCFNQTLQNCPEVTISNSHFVYGGSDGLGLYLGVAHGVSHMDGHRVSLEAGLGLGHGGSQLQSSL